MRDNIRYYRRRIAKNGGLEFETADASNFRQLFNMLLHLHCSRWKARRQNDVLSDSEVQSFHREAG